MADLDLTAIENRLDFGHRDSWTLLAEARRLRELVAFRESEIATLNDALIASRKEAQERKKVFVLLHEGEPLPEGFGPVRVEGVFSTQANLHQGAMRRLEEFRGDPEIQAVAELAWDSDGVAKIDRRHLGSRPTFKAEEYFVDWLSELQSPSTT